MFFCRLLDSFKVNFSKDTFGGYIIWFQTVLQKLSAIVKELTNIRPHTDFFPCQVCIPCNHDVECNSSDFPRSTEMFWVLNG